MHVPGVAVEAVDTTGAGDLFAAAYVWADHWGAGLDRAAALGGAVRVPLREGRHRGCGGGDIEGALGGGR